MHAARNRTNVEACLGSGKTWQLGLLPVQRSSDVALELCRPALSNHRSLSSTQMCDDNLFSRCILVGADCELSEPGPISLLGALII